MVEVEVEVGWWDLAHLCLHKKLPKSSQCECARPTSTLEFGEVQKNVEPYTVPATRRGLTAHSHELNQGQISC